MTKHLLVGGQNIAEKEFSRMGGNKIKTDQRYYQGVLREVNNLKKCILSTARKMKVRGRSDIAWKGVGEKQREPSQFSAATREKRKLRAR